MNLDEAQRMKVAEWVGQGLKLSDIQNRINSELKLGLTYMEVRLLVDDLKLTPKDAEPAKPLPSALASMASPGQTLAGGTPPPRPGAPKPGGVSMSVDQL